MRILKTNDQSDTVWSEQYGENYHSTYGAWTESMHVFINAGFKNCMANPMSIFEMGFGTGLNAFLTLLEAEKTTIPIYYYAIELHPIGFEIIQQLDYIELTNPGQKEIFLQLHKAAWNFPVEITSNFTLHKIQGDILFWHPGSTFDLVFFDAFSPNSQPELWTSEIFQKLNKCMNNQALLTTYCAKGSVRRNLISAGFSMERLPGPPGKREMLRATKK
jgi:tRNA U34 5-methylaminomethyl-2-thiouridine-forming methyltransferase MnmC